MIKKLIIHNLKSIDSMTIELKDKNFIYGRNGVGKSTIKEAITFVLYGKINNTDRIDEAIRTGEKEAKVTMVVDVAGKDLIISRTRTIKGSFIEINGRPSDQADVQAMFGLYDYFVCGNFIGEFMKYTEAERRQLLLNMFEPVDRETLYKQLTGLDPSGGVDLTDLEATEKRIKSQLKAKENDRFLLSSQKETLNADLFRLKDELASLKGAASQDYSGQITNLKIKLDQITLAKPDKASFIANKPDTSEIDRAIAKITTEVMELVAPTDPAILSIEMRLKQLKAEYTNLQGSKVCPTCNRPYDNLSHINTKLVELEATMKSDFEQWKTLKANLESETKAYNEYRAELIGKRVALEANKQELLMSVEMYQSELDEKYSNALGKWNIDVQVLRTELDKLSALQQDYETSKIRIDSAMQNITSLETKVNLISSKIKETDTSELENIMKAFGPKGIRFQELLSQQNKVNSKLPENIKIEFMKENKTTDGYKPVFNVLMDGISYPWLSTGMKMLADLHLLKLFSGRFIAIDNYEAYTGQIPEDLLDRQLICLIAVDSDIRVDSYDKELKPVKKEQTKIVKKPTKVVKKPTKSKAK